MSMLIVHAACPCLHVAGQNSQGRHDYQDRTARKVARTEQPERTARKRTAMIASTGRPEYDSQNGTARMGQPERDSQNRASRTGQAKRDRQNRTRKAGQAEQDRQIGTGRTEQAKQDRQNRTGRRDKIG
jgi:hypothetical protein